MKLSVRSGAGAGTTIELAGSLVVGRGDDCGLVLADEKASRHHARFTAAADGTVTVEDLGSTNGTFVGGARIARATRLEPGSEVVIGDTRLALDDTATPAAAPSPTTFERITLRRSARRARLLAGAAAAILVAAIVVVVLLATGAFEDEQPTVPEVIEQLTPSTVQILAVEDDDSATVLGTGWVLDAGEGLIVTNAHVANAWNDFDIRLGDRDRRRRAEIVGTAPCEDLALLRVVDTEGLQAVPLSDQDDLRQGDTVVALGFPTTATTGQPLVASRGVVSVVRAETVEDGGSVGLPNVVQTDAAINPGNSGGPLVNLAGELVGVNTLKNVSERVESQFYAIGVDRVREITDTLRQGRSLGWAGTTIAYPATEDELTSRDLPAVAGVILDRTVDGTGAAEAGLGETPALLVGVDGTTIDNTEIAYCAAVGELTDGDTATLSVILAGETEPRDVVVEFE
jgi:S1-C subfamily serine protease